MIINNSQISMDASTGHKDVSSTAGRVLSRNHSGRRDAHFRLDLPRLEHPNGREAGVHLNGSQRTRSSTTSEISTDKLLETEAVITRALEQLTGTKNSLKPSSFPGLAPLHQEQRPEGLHTGRRFFRIGSQQFSMSFVSHRVHYEHEFLDFTSSGTVETADGRSISFTLDLSMQRTSVVQQSVIGRAAAGFFVDPLVLHFESGLEALAEQRFLFDIDGDDVAENIAGLPPGSGFLALDIDGDRLITSGRELFGPLSGSGFGDLAVHDLDENGWIDENDPIFSKLLVWMNASGQEQELLPLKEAGVGAISLNNTASLFNLKTPANDLLGQVSASGIFLTEAGVVRSLQDLNLAVASPEDQDNALPARDTDRALAALRSFISARRSELTLLALQRRNRPREIPDSEDLRWKFWQWHDRHAPPTSG